VATPRGTLIIYCEARKNTRGDWGTIDLMLRRSTDGGKTWEPARKIAAPPGDVKKNPVALAQNLAGKNEITLNNPVAIADRDGTVHFLYCVEYARCFYLRSRDKGATWSEPREITGTFEAFREEYSWKVLATGPGHGIQMQSGRLIVPVWLSTGTGGHAHRPSVNSVIFSDDHGQTWKRGAIVSGESRPKNPSETVAVELAGGGVMLNFRHESFGKGRAVAVSQDGAHSWSPVRFDQNLPEPICMGSMARLSQRPGSDRNRLLFCNPNNPIDRRRRNVTVKLSYDEGQSWPMGRSIEPGVSGYSDLAAGPGGAIYCFYERSSASESHFNPAALCLARFNLEWLTEGLDGLKG